MNRSKRIGIDLDGVLADFNTAYVKLMTEIQGEGPTLPAGWQPPTWSYESLLGFTEETVEKAWQHIKSSDFWFTLKPLTNVNIRDLSSHNDVYFMTVRPGHSVKEQSGDWLEMMYGVIRPTVLICQNKGPVAAGLGLDLLVDDRDKNILDVRKASPRTKCVILDYPYNRTFEDPAVTRVASLDEVFIDGHVREGAC